MELSEWCLTFKRASFSHPEVGAEAAASDCLCPRPARCRKNVDANWWGYQRWRGKSWTNFPLWNVELEASPKSLNASRKGRERGEKGAFDTRYLLLIIAV